MENVAKILAETEVPMEARKVLKPLNKEQLVKLSKMYGVDVEARNLTQLREAIIKETVKKRLRLKYSK